jgi:hypothetical protein
MNYAKTKLLILLFLISSLSFAQTTVNGGRVYLALQDMHLGSWRAPEATIGAGAHQLPSASTSTGLIYMVTDGATTSDCTTGSGTSFVNACRSNGTSWVFIGGSGGGGGGGTWGSITGTLSSQTDLNTALNARLIAANNLSDLASAPTARTNLGLGTAATQNTGTSGGTLCLLSASACAFTNSPTFPTPASSDNSTNGATTAYVTTAISNLSLGTASTKAISFFLQSANNLSDLGSASTARTNLGLGSAAVANTGTSGGTLCLLNATACTFTNSPVLPTPASSDNSTNGATTAYVQTAITNLSLGTASTKAIAFFLQSANNLSDLASASTARTNLGLGTAATQNTGTSGSTLCLLNAAACAFTNSPTFPTLSSADNSTNGATTAYVTTAIANLSLGTASTHAISFFLQSANNLSDLGNAATARTNLGLGSIATHPTTDFVSATATYAQNQVLASPNGSTGALTVRAIVAADIPTLNQNTTGNAATATALASTPTLCTTGQAPTGILANGNATGCAAIGGSTSVHNYTFRSINQNTISGSNFSIPASNAPTPVSVEGASSGDITTLSSAWNYGTLSFAANSTSNTANSVQGMIPLASTWSSSAGITLQITWRTSATSNAVVWAIQGQCVASGALPGSFSSGTAMSASTAAGTTEQWTATSTLTMTTSNVLSGCSAGNDFMFRLYRDHQISGGADTLTSAAELVQAVFGVTQ